MSIPRDHRFVTIGARLRELGLRYQREIKYDMFTDEFRVSTVAPQQAGGRLIVPHMFVSVRGLSQLSRLVDMLEIARLKGQNDGRTV